jgi:cytochrome c biogenesis protein CcmG/thiol:disulfide interchange protein DsbE
MRVVVKRLIPAGLMLAMLLVPAWPASAAGPLHAGDTAPAFSLQRLGAPGSVSLASLHGKPIYLNFFATWCGPCNDEAPSVVSLEKTYRPRGLVAIGVNEQESAAKAKSFVDKYHIPFTVLLDSDGKMGGDYGVIAMPVHVFIDRKGKVSTYRLGEMNPSEIEAAIKKILSS